MIRLLDDPNRIVFEAVKAALLKEGVSVVPVLLDVRDQTPEGDMHKRIDEIIGRLQFADTHSAIIDWLEDGADDLLYGAYLAARFVYPDLEFTPINELVNRLWRELRLDVKDARTPAERVRVINTHFFETLGFRKNMEEPMSPRNNCINDVLDTRRGNHLTLAILYCELCRRIGLPICCVSLPKVLILCYLNDTVLRADDLLDVDDVLFYINPANNGAILVMGDILTFLDQQNIDRDNSYYLPCSNSEVVKRLLINMLYAFTAAHDEDRMRDAKILIQTISNYIEQHKQAHD